MMKTITRSEFYNADAKKGFSTEQSNGIKVVSFFIDSMYCKNMLSDAKAKLNEETPA
jgi:hypothetical protein